MNIVLWVLQVVLAVMFLGAGLVKTTRTKAQLPQKWTWAGDYSAGTIKFIGVTQLLGAAGLILPALTGIATFLTPLAAVGLAIIMALAAIEHARRNEPRDIVVNIVVLLACLVVVWGRFGPYSL